MYLLVSMKAVLERPIAGSQVPFCSLEKKMMDCWSDIEPDTFRVRGENYFRYILINYWFNPRDFFNNLYHISSTSFFSTLYSIK